MPSAPDGDVERNGYFLTIETKIKSEELSVGQSIYYQNRAKAPFTTAILVRIEDLILDSGALDFIPVGIAIYRADGTLMPEESITFEQFIEFYRCWYANANGREGIFEAEKILKKVLTSAEFCVKPLK